jgi:hypothetical protein
MSTKLEDPMKDATKDIILNNKHKIFSRSECTNIAAWAFKTTILANHMSLPPDQNPFFSYDQRRKFARSQAIPRGVQVWIAQRNAGHLTARWMSSLRIMQPGAPTSTHMHLKNIPASMFRFEIYDCVFSVGYLLLQVTAARWAERQIANRLNVPTVTQGETFDRQAVPIWPNPPDTVLWPPPAAIGNELFPIFCERFEKFALPWW